MPCTQGAQHVICENKVGCNAFPTYGLQPSIPCCLLLEVLTALDQLLCEHTLPRLDCHTGAPVGHSIAPCRKKDFMMCAALSFVHIKTTTR